MLSRRFSTSKSILFQNSPTNQPTNQPTRLTLMKLSRPTPAQTPTPNDTDSDNPSNAPNLVDFSTNSISKRWLKKLPVVTKRRFTRLHKLCRKTRYLVGQFNCHQFTHWVVGGERWATHTHQFTGANQHDNNWSSIKHLRHLQTKALKPGDVVIVCDTENPFDKLREPRYGNVVHSGIYIGDGLCVSKYGWTNSWLVTPIEQMVSDYASFDKVSPARYYLLAARHSGRRCASCTRDDFKLFAGLEN